MEAIRRVLSAESATLPQAALWANRRDAVRLIDKVIAGNSPPISGTSMRVRLRLDPATISAGLALISPRQDWLQGRSRAMCVAVRAGGRTAHEKQIFRKRS
jgi:hypothetical protein